MPTPSPKTNRPRALIRLTELERRDMPGSFLDLVCLGSLDGLTLGGGVQPSLSEVSVTAESDRLSIATPVEPTRSPLEQKGDGGQPSPESERSVPVLITVFDPLANQPDPLSSTEVSVRNTLPSIPLAAAGSDSSRGELDATGGRVTIALPVSEATGGATPKLSGLEGPPLMFGPVGGGGTGGGGGGGEPRVVNGDMNAVRTDGQGEENAGWVSVNNDNDNYNFYGDQETSLDQLPDLAEYGQVVGEDDLIAIAIHPVTGAIPGDKVSVRCGSANVTLWRTPDKSGDLWLPTFDATQMNYVYAEGLSLSSEVGAELVEMWWKNTLDPLDVRLLDVVPLTAYQVVGAQNVPGYSRHVYEGSVPGGSALGWGPVTNGGDLVVSPSKTVNNITTNTGTVLWGEGAALGKVKVTAAPGFSKDVEVNVVKVQLDGAGATNYMKFRDDRVQASTFNLHTSPDTKGDFSKEFMQAELRVANVEGVGGQKRGERFISFGWMQIETFTYRHADFNTLGQVNRNSVEGKTYKDSFMNENSAWMVTVDDKWYRALARDGVAENDNVLLRTYDSPSGPFTNALTLKNTTTNVTDDVDFYSWVLDFHTDFGVQTRETANGANLSYTTRARASWRIEGSQYTQVVRDAAGGRSVSFSRIHPVTGAPLEDYARAYGGGAAPPTYFYEVRDGLIYPLALINGITGSAAAGNSSWTNFQPPIEVV